MSDDASRSTASFVDDIVVSTGDGHDLLRGRRRTAGRLDVPGRPRRQPGQPERLDRRHAADVPPPVGTNVDAVVRPAAARSSTSWRATSGRIRSRRRRHRRRRRRDRVRAREPDAADLLRQDFFGDPFGGDAVVVHELAHQWFGDSLAVERWQHIWLNEGFATYAEWLWSEHEGLGTAQELFDFFYDAIPRRRPVLAGDDRRSWPGAAVRRPGLLPRRDDACTAAPGGRRRRLLHDPADAGHGRDGGRQREDRRVHPLAERVSGQELDDLFQAWLFTPGRPELPAALRPERSRAAAVPQVAKQQRPGSSGRSHK